VRRSDHPSFVVGIGGSAGGLPAYRSLLATLPADTGMAFVFIAHLKPDEKSWLTQILSTCTPMRVLQAAASMPIQANQVYVIPPNVNLLVERLAFKVVSPRTMHGGRHHQVDLFLISLADAVGARAVGVIFSGGMATAQRDACGLRPREDEHSPKIDRPKSIACLSMRLPRAVSTPFSPP
jgi:two-component system CheB/CheR fusion protein